MRHNSMHGHAQTDKRRCVGVGGGELLSRVVHLTKPQAVASFEGPMPGATGLCKWVLGPPQLPEGICCGWTTTLEESISVCVSLCV